MSTNPTNAELDAQDKELESESKKLSEKGKKLKQESKKLESESEQIDKTLEAQKQQLENQTIYEGKKVLKQDQRQRDEAEFTEKSKAYEAYNTQIQEYNESASKVVDEFNKKTKEFESEAEIYNQSVESFNEKLELRQKEFEKYKVDFKKEFGISYDDFIKQQEQEKKAEEQYQIGLQKYNDQIAEINKKLAENEANKYAGHKEPYYVYENVYEYGKWVKKKIKKYKSKSSLYEKYLSKKKSLTSQKNKIIAEKNFYQQQHSLSKSDLPQWAKNKALKLYRKYKYSFKKAFAHGQTATSIAKNYTLSKKLKEEQRARSSILSAQSAAIKAAEVYATNIKGYSSSIQKFNEKKYADPFKMQNPPPDMLKRMEAIKPQSPIPIATVAGYNLQQAKNRPTMTGVKFVKIQKQEPVQQKQKAEPVVSPYLTQYETKQVQGPPKPKYKEQEIKYIPGLAYLQIEQKPQEKNLGLLSYSELVDKGIAKPPQTLQQKAEYYIDKATKPITNLADYTGVPYLFGQETGDYRKENIVPTTTEKLFINAEQAVKGEKPILKGLEETWQQVKKDPIAPVVEFPAEAGLWIGGAKVVEAGVKYTPKVIAPISKWYKEVVKKQPYINKQTGKIYPNIKYQKQLTPEQVGSKSLIDEVPVIKVQKQVPPSKPINQFLPADKPIGTLGKPVKLDPAYTPAKPGKEIFIQDTKIAGYKVTDYKLGTAQAKPVPKSKAPPKVVQPDPFYTPKLPKARYDKIDKEQVFRQDKAFDVKSEVKIKLPTAKEFEKGKKFTETLKEKPLGTLGKTVELDPTYKPNLPLKQYKKIDQDAIFNLDEAYSTFSTKKVNLGKSTLKAPKDKSPLGTLNKPVKPDKSYTPTKDAKKLKDAVQDDKKLYGFTESKAPLGGGIISKSGQKTIQIQKTKTKTKSKKLTSSTAPAPIDWTLKEASKEIPKTGVAPVVVLKQESKKKKRYDAGIKVMSGPAVDVELVNEYTRKVKSEPALKTYPTVEQKSSTDILSMVSSKASTKPVEIVRTKASIQPKTKTKVQTKQKSPIKSIQKRIQPEPTPAKPKQKTTGKFGPKTRTRVTTKTPNPRWPKQIAVPITTPPPDKKPEKKKPKTKTKKKKLKEYVGNVPITKIIGVHDRPTITYDTKKKKTRTIAKKEIRKERSPKLKTKVKVW